MLLNKYSPHVSSVSEEQNDFMSQKRIKLDSEEVAGSSRLPDTQRATWKRKGSYVDSREDRNCTVLKRSNKELEEIWRLQG